MKTKSVAFMFTGTTHNRRVSLFWASSDARGSIVAASFVHRARRVVARFDARAAVDGGGGVTVGGMRLVLGRLGLFPKVTYASRQ